MKNSESIDHRLKKLGETFRGRPSIAPQVMNELEILNLDELNENHSTNPVNIKLKTDTQNKTKTSRFKKSWLVLTGSTIALCSLLLFLSIEPSIGKDSVGKAMKAQKWIHSKIRYENGKTGEIWISHQNQIYAFKNFGRSIFYDGKQKIRKEFSEDYPDKGLTIFPMTDTEIQDILPLDDFQKDPDQPVYFSPFLLSDSKVVIQKRTIVRENNKKWIDFEFSFLRWQSKMGVLRVDPETQLPVSMKLSFNKSRWIFDYPEDGPKNIYALGVPQDAPIDDLRLPKTGADALKELTKSRQKIGNFRLLIVEKKGMLRLKVWRKGSKWRVDNLGFSQGPHLDDKKKWWDPILKIKSVPYRFCDGKNVYTNENHLPELNGEPVTPKWVPETHQNPDSLLAPGGNATFGVNITSMYPDLVVYKGFQFDFISQPKTDPGLLLIKRAAKLATPGMVGHDWFYLDPPKGYAMVRQESFNLPINTEPIPKQIKKKSIIWFKNYKRSPQGFWYPQMIKRLSLSDPPSAHQRAPDEYHFHYDFDLEISDDLFEMSTIK